MVWGFSTPRDEFVEATRATMPQINVNESWFGACFHVDDLDALYAGFSRAGIPSTGVPRLTVPYIAPFGLRKFEMIDEDGNLIHCLENKRG